MNSATPLDRYISIAKLEQQNLLSWRGKDAGDMAMEPGPRGPGFEIFNLGDKKRMSDPGLTLTKTSGLVFAVYSGQDFPSMYADSLEWRMWNSDGCCIGSRLTHNFEGDK